LSFMPEPIADWAWSVLNRPGGGRVSRHENQLIDAEGRPVGQIDNGVVRFTVSSDDASIEYYRSIGGAHFNERSSAAYAMTTLDTPIYHGYLRQVAPRRRNAVVVDVGGGDGRNAFPWLEWGYKKVVVIDPVATALRRFRDRVAACNASWLQRLLLIKSDARALPLASRCADRVLAIESLSYLNEDFERGLRECRRIMRPDALLLLADRDYEGALLARLFYYGGVAAMLEMGGSRDLWDGIGEKRVRSRCFTSAELSAAIKGEGLRVLEAHGISSFSLILSFLSKLDRLGETSEAQRDEVGRLLSSLGQHGSMLRSHVLIAGRGRRSARNDRTGKRPANNRGRAS
jgi:SAM-dependent methyltransferase